MEYYSSPTIPIDAQIRKILEEKRDAMCDYCGDMDNRHLEARLKNNKLYQGKLGKKMVQFFIDNGYEALPTEADMLGYAGEDTVNYRVTFDDESVADIQFVFEPGMSLDILSVEEYNRVI